MLYNIKQIPKRKCFLRCFKRNSSRFSLNYEKRVSSVLIKSNVCLMDTWGKGVPGKIDNAMRILFVYFREEYSQYCSEKVCPAAKESYCCYNIHIIKCEWFIITINASTKATVPSDFVESLENIESMLHLCYLSRFFNETMVYHWHWNV